MSTKPKITLTMEDLTTPEVEQRLKQQQALESAQAASLNAAATPSRLPVPGEGEERGSLWVNTFFNMTVFGLLGGLLAWGSGEVVKYFNPDLEAEADRLIVDVQDVIRSQQQGRLNTQAANTAIRELEAAGADNPWFRLKIDTKLTKPQKEAEVRKLRERDYFRNLFADICFYCACGTLIAVALGMAESVASRNFRGAIVYGCVGTLMGLVGGVIVSLFAEPLYRALSGARDLHNLTGQVVARALAWGVLGMFLAAAPGVVLVNGRKLMLGLLGGLIGGLVGGALFVPIRNLSGSDVISRLVAVTAIGVITGVGTGIIENVAKVGWMKVVAGLIAGKQFILYRNPTFIGAAPQCEIYLFKDNRVGRRHAAVHILKGGYELEDMGSTTGTLVNGRRILRTRLRSGDRIQIGGTAFLFQEKAKSH